MREILIVDNYDSFVYNVQHLVINAAGIKPVIVKNNSIPFETIGRYSHILLSPGPGLPDEAGDLIKLIDTCHKSHSILGICLGHQAIAQYFGAGLINLSHPLHGHTSAITLTSPEDPLLKDFNDTDKVGLYHSWAVSPHLFPKQLVIGSRNEQNIIMSIYHKWLPVFGVQFHPESVISTKGVKIIENWLAYN